MSLEELIQRTVDEVRARADEERTEFKDARRASVMEWAAVRFERALNRYVQGGVHRPKRGPQARSGVPRPTKNLINITPIDPTN